MYECFKLFFDSRSQMRHFLILTYAENLDALNTTTPHSFISQTNCPILSMARASDVLICRPSPKIKLRELKRLSRTQLWVFWGVISSRVRRLGWVKPFMEEWRIDGTVNDPYLGIRGRMARLKPTPESFSLCLRFSPVRNVTSKAILLVVPVRLATKNSVRGIKSCDYSRIHM